MAEPQYVLGIDVGLGGALALLMDGRYVQVVDMPTITRGSGTGRTKRQVDAACFATILAGWLRVYGMPDAILEHVSAMPGQGVSAMFSLGDSFGVVRGVLAACRIPVQTVHPSKWKRHCGLIGAEKDAARTLASQWYPDAPLGLKKHIGRADALLLARYLYEQKS